MQWQMWVTVSCVIGAVVWLALRLRQWSRGESSGCHNCSTCPNSAPTSPDRVITEDEISLPND